MSHPVTRLLLATSALALAMGAAACGRSHHGGWMDEERAQKMMTWKVDDVLDDIDATDAQRKAVHAEKDTLLTKALAKKQEQDKDKKEIRDQLASDSPDADRLHALVDGAATRWTEMGHEAIDAALRLHKQLDKSQRRALAETYDERQR